MAELDLSPSFMLLPGVRLERTRVETRGVQFDAEAETLIADHLQLDLSASYQATSRSRIFVELVNLTNEPLTACVGSPERPIQTEFYQPSGRIGVRMSW